MNFLKNKKVIIIVSIIALIVVTVSIVLIKGKKKNVVIAKNSVPNFDIEINSIQSIEAQTENEIQDIFSKIREHYRENKQINSNDKIENYYNNIRLEMETENIELSFVNLTDIPTKNQVLHNLEGKMITEVPTPTVNGQEVNISSDSFAQIGKYYILRAHDNLSSYTFYYVATFDNTGNVKLEWLCFTENEVDEIEKIAKSTGLTEEEIEKL